MRRWPEDRLAFGGEYNPEQWPRETWTEDVNLMARAGAPSRVASTPESPHP